MLVTYARIQSIFLVIVRMVKEANPDIPCTVGFGISTPEQAAKMAAVSDGAIVGSAIIKMLEKYGVDAPGYVGKYVRAMAEAVAASS